AKFHAGVAWDAQQDVRLCRSYLNVWDGQLWAPSNCDGLYCGDRTKLKARPGSSAPHSGPSGRKNVTLLARYCKEHVSRSCDHSALANATRLPRPCTLAESFLTSGDSLTLELKLADSTALRPVTFKALYEFVDLHVDGEPYGDGPCSRRFGNVAQGDNDAQHTFRSPRDVFLYGRGGAKNISCVYRFEVNKDERIKITLTEMTIKHRACQTVISKDTNRLDCLGNSSATLRFYELPWADVPGVPRDCLCAVDKDKLIPFTYVSTTNVVELRFNVIGMNASDDFDSLFFEGSWKFIKTPGCERDLRLRGPSGEVVFSYPPPPEQANCEFNPRVIIPAPNKYLYVKIRGSIMKHSTKMGNGTIRTITTGQHCDTANRIMIHTALYTAQVCPSERYSRAHLVEVFSEGWHPRGDQAVDGVALERIQIDRLGLELSKTVVVEFYGRQEGEYSIMWLELARRRDYPPNGLGLFMMHPDECQFLCPELAACVDPSVWCDGLEDCPSGIDEALTHCSLLFQLPPVYLFFGALGVIVSSILTILILWKTCRRRPRSILQTRLKSLSSDTAIIDEKGIYSYS
ncbi:unnamed protein product, partial [Phaedon cochleariae]